MFRHPCALHLPRVRVKACRCESRTGTPDGLGLELRNRHQCAGYQTPGDAHQRTLLLLLIHKDGYGPPTARSSFFAESLATKAGLLDTRSSFSFSLKRGRGFFSGFFRRRPRPASETNWYSPEQWALTFYLPVYEKVRLYHAFQTLCN